MAKQTKNAIDAMVRRDRNDGGDDGGEEDKKRERERERCAEV
jgi:hypothetical protein